MKQIQKKPAILLIVMLAVILAIGAIFAFVPMTFGATTYKSFAGAIRLGNDFGNSMYAEYDIKNDGSTEVVDVQKSISSIKNILSEQGYPSTSVYSINNEKIRVEVPYQNDADGFKDAYTLLKAVGVGKFELRSSSKEEDTYIVGSRHITGVSISNYTSYTYVTLEFNSDGEKAFAELLDASTTIYVCMGGQTQTSFSSENVTAGKSLPLTFSDYNSAVDFAMKVKLGSVPVDVNSETVVINTINDSSSILPIVIAIAVLVVAALVYFAVVYGLIGYMNIVSTIFTSILAVILFWAISIIEFNTSSFLALVLGFALTVMVKNIYMSRVREEYMTGKTIEASLESGYKKSIAPIVATLVTALIPAVVLSFVSTGILQTASLILVIMCGIGAFESLLFIPWLINICEAFNKGNSKIYNFKREEV